MNILVHLYIVKGEDLEWRVADHEDCSLHIIAYHDGAAEMFKGRARHLQEWCAKRGIGYEHRVLNIPIELE